MMLHAAQAAAPNAADGFDPAEARSKYRCRRACYMVTWAFIIGVLCGGVGFLASGFEYNPEDVVDTYDPEINAGTGEGALVNAVFNGFSDLSEATDYNADNITGKHMSLLGSIGFFTGFFSTIVFQGWRLYANNQNKFSFFNVNYYKPSHDTKHDHRSQERIRKSNNVCNSDFFHWRTTIFMLITLAAALVSGGIIGYNMGGGLTSAGLGMGVASLICGALFGTTWLFIRKSTNVNRQKFKGKDKDYHSKKCIEHGLNNECICGFDCGVNNRKQYEQDRMETPTKDDYLYTYCQKCYREMTHVTCTNGCDACRCSKKYCSAKRKQFCKTCDGYDKNDEYKGTNCKKPKTRGRLIRGAVPVSFNKQ